MSDRRKIVHIGLILCEAKIGGSILYQLIVADTHYMIDCCSDSN